MNKCLYCGKETGNPKFCSTSCSAIYNNSLRKGFSPLRKSKNYCLVCGKHLSHRSRKPAGYCREHQIKEKKIYTWIDFETQIEMKHCPRCKKDLPVSEFYIKKDSEKFGYYCRKCHNKAGTETKKKRKLLAVQLLGGKCCRCNYNKCVDALEFHHTDPSKKDFAIGHKSVSVEKMKKELEKCILLCSNCHREEHAKQQEEKEKNTYET